MTSHTLQILRLGTLDDGAVAAGCAGGVVQLESGGEASATVEWWIGGDDRWHRPSVEPSTRDRAMGGRPVLESRARVPSGDAVALITAGRADGSDRSAVFVDIHNDSPLPVAVAYVVSSTEPMIAGKGGIGIAGVGALALTRPALGWLSARTADELLLALEAGQFATEPPAPGSGVCAVVVPLPHTAHSIAVLTPDANATLESPTPADREGVPGADRVAAGWGAHLDRGPRIDLGDETLHAAFEAAACDVLLGSGDDVSALTAGLVAEALAVLGRIDDPGPMVDLLDHQRSSGAVGDRSDDRIAATAQLLRAAAAWWSAGPGEATGELMLGPVAQAAHWLSGGRRRQAVAAHSDPVDGRTVPAALRGVVGMLLDMGQPELAAAVGRQATEHVDAESGPATITAGPAATPNAPATPVARSAATVIATLASVAREDGVDLLIAPGWTPGGTGAAWEAHDLLTRWGRLSYALRWHGERPALLWELVPFPDRAPAVPPRIRAIAIDPEWSSVDLRGDTLLAAPPHSTDRAHDIASTDQTGALDGGTFS